MCSLVDSLPPKRGHICHCFSLLNDMEIQVGLASWSKERGCRTEWVTRKSDGVGSVEGGVASWGRQAGENQRFDSEEKKSLLGQGSFCIISLSPGIREVIILDVWLVLPSFLKSSRFKHFV